MTRSVVVCALLSMGLACTSTERQPEGSSAAETTEAGTERQQHLDEILTAERSFAAAAQRMATRDAFLAFLAEGSVLFRPGPVDGREYMTGVTPGSGSLEWGPAYADISADGDLGFTFGPYTSRNAEGEGVRWGEYTSMWARQPDGSLEVMLDTGTSYPEPEGDYRLGEMSAESFTPPRPNGHDEGTLTVLLDMDARGPARLGAEGHRTRDTRVFRSDAPSGPLGDRSDSGLFPDGTWTPVGGGVSSSRDLGYTYGTITNSTHSTWSYLHVWRCCTEDGDWIQIVDVVSPH